MSRLGCQFDVACLAGLEGNGLRVFAGSESTGGYRFPPVVSVVADVDFVSGNPAFFAVLARRVFQTFDGCFLGQPYLYFVRIGGAVETV